MSWLAQAAAAVWGRRSGRAAVVVLAAIAAAAMLGPLVLPDPSAQPDIIAGASQPPGPAHPFGTDQLSRDVLSRVVSGARISLAVAGLAVLLSMTIGAAVGLTAGYVGGGADALLMRIVDGGLAIMVTVLAVNLLGDDLSDAFESRVS